MQNLQPNKKEIIFHFQDYLEQFKGRLDQVLKIAAKMAFKAKDKETAKNIYSLKFKLMAKLEWQIIYVKAAVDDFVTKELLLTFDHTLGTLLKNSNSCG